MIYHVFLNHMGLLSVEGDNHEQADSYAIQNGRLVAQSSAATRLVCRQRPPDIPLSSLVTAGNVIQTLGESIDTQCHDGSAVIDLLQSARSTATMKIYNAVCNA